MNGIALGTRLGFAICVLLLMPIFFACSLCGIVAATFDWYMDGGCFAWPGAVASDADGGHHRVDDVVVVVECHWLLDCRR